MINQNALLLLCTDSKPNLIQIILDDSSLTNKASIILASQNPSSAQIAHLSSLTLSAMRNASASAIQSCWYIEMLMGFLDNTSVLAFFEKLLYEDITLTLARKWLVENGFPKDVANRLKNTIKNALQLKSQPESYVDPLYSQFYGLYSIIIWSMSNKYLSKYFITKEMINLLTFSFPNPPAYVNGKRMSAICSMCNASTAAYMIPFITYCQNLLFNNVKTPNSELVECINFFSKLMDTAPNLFLQISTSQFYQSLLRIIMQFETASILHSSFRTFVLKALANDKFSPRIIKTYVPFFISEATRNKKNSLTASYWALLLKVVKISQFNTSIESVLRNIIEYPHFAAKTLQHYHEILEAEYGGSTFRLFDNLGIEYLS